MKYIVWSLNGTTNPTKQHPDRASAQRAAQAMARLHPPDTFYACALTDAYTKADVLHEDLAGKSRDDDIPF